MIKRIRPVWGRVLVRPDDISDTDPALKAAKDAGIYVPDEDLKKEQYKQITGTIIAIGGDAFNEWSEWNTENENENGIPEVGSRIIYDLYAGMDIDIQTITHQIINDTDVIAIIQDEGDQDE